MAASKMASYSLHIALLLIRAPWALDKRSALYKGEGGVLWDAAYVIWNDPGLSS